MISNNNFYTLDNKRLALFDNLRGFIIIIAIVANFINLFNKVPFYFHHANDINAIYIPDLVIPFLVFIMSILYFKNFNYNKEKNGLRIAIAKTIRRGVLLVTIGFLFGIINNLLKNPNTNFVVEYNFFIMYGLVLLLAIPFTFIKKPMIKTFIGFSFIIVHQLLLRINSYLAYTISIDCGGVIGLIPWLGLVLICGVIGELFFHDKKNFYIYSSIMIGIGLIFLVGYLLSNNNFFYLSKLRITSGYIFISLSIVLIIFYICFVLKFTNYKMVPLVSDIGKNSLIFFLYGGGIGEVVKLIYGLDNINNSYLFTIIAILTYMILIIVPAFFFYKYKVHIRF